MAEDKEEKDIVKPDATGEVFLDKKEAEQGIEPTESKEDREVADDKAAHEKIRGEIENMDLADALKAQVQSSANDLQSLQTKEKLEKLLQTAKEKGIIFAVNVAKKMNDPYVLDVFHDELVKEGYYKEFLK